MTEESDNIIDFAEALLNRNPHDLLPITEEYHAGAYRECQHMRVSLDDQTHRVTCRECEKDLDPFWYLQLLAREWKHRAYQDEYTLKAHAELEQQRKNAQARGHYYERPSDALKAGVWDAFVDALGEAPISMFRQGSQWMAEVIVGGYRCFLALEYAQSQAALQARGGGG